MNITFPRLTAVASLLIVSSVSSPGQKPEPVLRTVQMVNPPTGRDAQELFTVLRTVADISTVSLPPASSALSLGGTQNQVAMAEWIAHDLDHFGANIGEPDAAIHQYRLPGPQDDVVRIFYFTHIDTPMGVQELLTVLRTVIDVQKVFNYTSLKAIAVRGTGEKIGQAAWLVSELDRTPDAIPSGTQQFQSSDKSTPVLRVFFSGSTAATGGVQALVTALRTQLRVQKTFQFDPLNAVVVGGSAEVVAQAAQLIEERKIASAR